MAWVFFWTALVNEQRDRPNLVTLTALNLPSPEICKSPACFA